MRLWYLAAVFIIIVERIATFTYFIPTMVKLMGAEHLSEVEVKAALLRWLIMNHGRHALTLAGWLASLRAFSLPRVAANQALFLTAARIMGS